MYLDKRLSEITDHNQLTQAVLDRFKADYDFRNRSIEVNGFDRSKTLFESVTGDNTQDSSIPRVNLIHRAVEDYLSVAVSNVPAVKLVVDKKISPKDESWKKEVKFTVLQETEKVLNAYVNTVLKNNDYPDEIQEALRNSAVFGVGYLMVDIDASLDIRFAEELEEIINKNGELTMDDVDRIDYLSKNIVVRSVDPRQVFWMHDVHSARDKRRMLRVSLVEKQNIHVLREEYAGNLYTNAKEIRAGDFPHFVDERISHTTADENMSTSAAVLTTWELEPVASELVYGGAVIPFTDYILHKIVIAGGKLVEHTINRSKDHPVRLPLIPFYLRESIDHPYGWSVPRMLEKSEEYINAMQTIAYKSAKKAVSGQGVILSIPNLGEGDMAEIENVLEEGGVARIRGNNPNGIVDIREMVMPMNFNVAPINPAVLQALNMELGMFRAQSQEIDSDAMGRARTGAAKRAQIASTDRPKTISLSLLNRGAEDLYLLVARYARKMHKTAISIMVTMPGIGPVHVTLNEPYKRNIVVKRPERATYDNPEGFFIETFEIELNSTSAKLSAQADGRGVLPSDMFAKVQLLSVLMQLGLIQAETMRELSLDEDIKSFDDRMRAVTAERQALMQEAQMLMQGQQQGQQAQQTMQQMGNFVPSPNEMTQDMQNSGPMAPAAMSEMG